MNLFSTILAVNFVLLWCQFEHSQQQKNVSGCQSLFAKIIFHPEVLLNAVQLRSPPAALVHCALILNIDEWKILKIPRIPAANSLLPHFRASVLHKSLHLKYYHSMQQDSESLSSLREIITSRGIDWNTCFDFNWYLALWHVSLGCVTWSRGDTLHSWHSWHCHNSWLWLINWCWSVTHEAPVSPGVPIVSDVTTPVTVSITDSGMRSGIDPLFITQHPNPQWDIWKRWLFGESRVSVVTLAWRLSLTLQRWQQRPIIPSTIWGAQCQKKSLYLTHLNFKFENLWEEAVQTRRKPFLCVKFKC